MRYTGIFMMAGALMAGGFWAAEKWKERLKLLLLFRQMVFYLKSQILYSNATLPEALGEVGRRFQDGKSGVFAEPGRLFLRVQKRVEEEGGIPFSAVWKEEVGRLPADFPMNAADRQALLSLGENLGYADRSMQERTLLFYLEQVEGAIAFLKKESESRTKLYRCLGMAAALFLIVVLV